MLICPACGSRNRPGARFCTQCATPLAPPPAERPASDDQAWLAATLSNLPASNAPAASRDDGPTTPGDTLQLASVPEPSTREIDMDQPETQPAATALFGGRYELAAHSDTTAEAIDRQPWARCWACGATSNEVGELFCTECGASLDGRRYHGQLLSGDQRHGLALVPEVKDEHARDILPPIWDQVREGDQLLTLAAETNRAPLSPPLDELDALRVGRGLANLLDTLHASGLALGTIAPADVELAADGQPRLRAVPGLQQIGAEEDAPTSDLRALAGLLEALTATPRTTQRFSEAEAEVTAPEPGLPDILRALRTGEIDSAGALATRLDALIAERTEPAALWVSLGALTHEGMVRELDEDSLLTLDLRMAQNGRGRSWGLYIVADGMGGHAAGEVASGLAIRGAAEVVMRAYLTPTLETAAVDEEARLKEVVRQAVLQGNEYVVREADARGNDMGTTMTLALVAGDRAIVGNIGDSRTYLYRDGALTRVSKDHSLVQRLVDLGQITADEVYTHPQRNAVLRSLGDRRELEVDTFSLRLRPGDALLLTSDGQWEMIHDPQMAEILAQHDDPQAACAALVTAANQAGGDDNITAVLIQFHAYDPGTGKQEA